MPVRRVRRCWSSPLQGEATPFSPSAGCGPLSWSITASHAMTVSAYMRVRSPLDGGGLYALRAGRCGCDSLSLAGSRQRVKSLRSSVRLRLVFYTARSILSGIDFGCAFVKSFTGSQESETVPSVHSVRPSLRHSSHRLAMRYPYRDGYVRSRYSVLRSCIRVPSSWFPRSRRSLKSPSSEPLQPLQLHTQHQLVRAAGLPRPNVVAVSTHIHMKCKWRSDPHHSHQPHPVRHLPRRTGLPAHILRDSVRFAPRDSQDVEPAHTDARPGVVQNFTGITRPTGTTDVYKYSKMAAAPPLSSTVQCSLYACCYLPT